MESNDLIDKEISLEDAINAAMGRARAQAGLDNIGGDAVEYVNPTAPTNSRIVKSGPIHMQAVRTPPSEE